MAEYEGTRKLEAIVAADVAGYSRLMQDDDEATVATLEDYRSVFRERIKAHRGRVVDMAGDSVLAVFPAATEAVRAAFEIQVELGERNKVLPAARRMPFRIGVNLGEVIERQDGTVYGDGVNVAARLEDISEPGGVTVSGTVFDQVRNRLQFGFDFIGEHEVKNIAGLVRAYRVMPEDAGGPHSQKRRAAQEQSVIGALKVLIVDDHALVRQGIALILRGMDASVKAIEAGDANEALQTLTSNPDVNLVLLDLQMPGTSGQEALPLFRKTHPDIPVVVVSATVDSTTVRTAIRNGAMGFIPKTHSADTMIGALKLILVHKGIYLPPDLLLSEPTSPAPLTTVGTPASTIAPGALGLTPRQGEILYWLLQGKSNKAIARLLDLTDNTVKSHTTAVLRALNVTTRTEAVIKSHQLGLVFANPTS
ncbi:MAG TPA: response regulator [Burkholderiales bacterium]|nr:response regulator [Burkholderiales bacterium]